MSSLRIATFNIQEMYPPPGQSKEIVVDWEKHVDDSGAPGFSVTEVTITEGQPLAQSTRLASFHSTHGDEEKAHDQAIRRAVQEHRKHRVQFVAEFKRWLANLPKNQ